MKRSFLAVLMLIAFSIYTMSVKAETLTVTYNTSSGISEANCIGTLVDGSTLGFYCSSYDSYAYFCGAISLAEAVEVPEKISYNNKEYDVSRCGYSSSSKLDMDDASNVTSLTLPSTITRIYSVPSSITDLHLKSTTPPDIYYTSSVPNSTTIWVPEGSIAAYISKTQDSYSNWYGREIHYEGWKPTSITVTVNYPGTFAQELLSKVEQFSDIDELTVKGTLNKTDLACLSRLKNAYKIDLSQTDIKSISGCTGLTRLKTIILPSTVVEVEDFAFNYCYALKDINLPNAKVIGLNAFTRCNSLISLNLPSVITIKDNSFAICSHLTTINCPSIKTIGQSAFELSNLESIYMPEVEIIGDEAFLSCEFTSIILPSSLQSLGIRSFYACSKLKDIYCNVICPLNVESFMWDYFLDATLHVPAFSLDAYIQKPNYSFFEKIVPLDNLTTELSINTFFNLQKLDGIADKADLKILADSNRNDLSNNGHLTISTDKQWNLNHLYQIQYIDSIYNNSSLISFSNVEAEKISVKILVHPNCWNFISFPFDVNVSDIQYPDGTLWVIRKYSGEDRAKMTGYTWQNMTDGTTLNAGEGYILHCTDGNSDSWNTSYVEFTFNAVNNSIKNNIFENKSITKSLSKYSSDLAHNRNWNLVGNPYPSFYDTRNIEHNGVITVWNGYGYTAYSLLDDQYVLRPNEAFFVQCPSDATSMKFKKEGRQHTYEAGSSASFAKAARVASDTKRQVFNLTISNAEYTDKARVVINESAKLDYEISCDASKFMSSNAVVPQIYILENGQKMAIDERPLSDGIINVGMYIGEAGDYTIGISATPTDVILTDNATGKSVNLRSEAYTFSAAKGTNDNRFSIQIGDATGIENISSDELKQPKIYNISGQKISMPQKGINIINGKKTIVR